jgi:hypothetical protein
VTDRFGDHCTKPIRLLFLGRFGCVKTSIVALTGFSEALYENRRRMRTRRVAAQYTVGDRTSPACTTPADVSPRRLTTTCLTTEWQRLPSP